MLAELGPNRGAQKEKKKTRGEKMGSETISRRGCAKTAGKRGEVSRWLFAQGEKGPGSQGNQVSKRKPALGIRAKRG